MKNPAILFSFLAVFLAVGLVQGGGFGVRDALSASSEKSAGGEGVEVKTPEFEYFQMQPLTLPVITDRGLTQQVSMVVSLEIPYGTLADVEPLVPRLADAYLQDLYGALGAGHALMQGNIVNVQAVKERLTAVTDQVLGDDKVHGVLLQVVQQRPM